MPTAFLPLLNWRAQPWTELLPTHPWPLSGRTHSINVWMHDGSKLPRTGPILVKTSVDVWVHLPRRQTQLNKSIIEIITELPQTKASPSVLPRGCLLHWLHSTCFTYWVDIWRLFCWWFARFCWTNISLGPNWWYPLASGFNSRCGLSWKSCQVKVYRGWAKVIRYFSKGFLSKKA